MSGVPWLSVLWAVPMLGAAVVLGLLGYAGNGLVRLLERRLTRWQHPA